MFQKNRRVIVCGDSKDTIGLFKIKGKNRNGYSLVPITKKGVVIGDPIHLSSKEMNTSAFLKTELSPSDFFNVTDHARKIPISRTQADHISPKAKQFRAKKYMCGSLKGEKEKRKPIFYEKRNGTYYVLDGNTTLGIFKEWGFSKIYGKDVTI